MPVLMLTAHDNVAERVRALDAGPTPTSPSRCRKIERPGLPQLIHTVRGVGFCLRVGALKG